MIESPKAVRGNFVFEIFLLTAFLICTAFFTSQLYQASQKPFWGDETFGISSTTHRNSYLSLILGAAHTSQSSPAPLDYLLLKPLNQMSEGVSYWGLKPEVYYRLVANISTTLAAFGLMLLFLNTKSPSMKNNLTFLQGILITFALVSFLFSRFVHYYAAETRPYAIWNAMYLLTLAVIIFRPNAEKFFIAVMTLLALSATASIFQLGLLGFAYFIILSFEKGWKKSLIKTFRVFLFPVAVSLFYCLRVSIGEMKSSGGTWNDFLDLWINKATIIPLFAVEIYVCLRKKETRSFAIAPLGFLLIFLAGPLIFKITEARGYFYSDRQYIYYDLGTPIFLLTLAQLIPFYLFREMPKTIFYVMVVVILVMAGSLTFRKKVSRKFIQSFYNSVLVFQNPKVIQCQVIDGKNDLP